MTKSRANSIAKVRNFSSLAEHDARAAKEGDVTTQVFDDHYEIRRIIHKGQAVYSVVDVVATLADTSNANRYWTDLKRSLRDEEGFPEVYEKIVTLRLPTRGGPQSTDCADIQTLLRIIQSIPSPKAEPFKQWLAQVGFERIQETAEPDKAAQRIVEAYRDQGYSDDWIEQRIKQSIIDSGWSDEISGRDVTRQGETSIRAKVHETALGVSQQTHRKIKGAERNADLPDRMNKIELLIDTLAKAAGAEIIKARDARGQDDVRDAAMTGARIAGNARSQIEDETKNSVITEDRTMDKPVDLKKLK